MANASHHTRDIVTCHTLTPEKNVQEAWNARANA
jgi:hypothetical protein